MDRKEHVLRTVKLITAISALEGASDLITLRCIGDTWFVGGNPEKPGWLGKGKTLADAIIDANSKLEEYARSEHRGMARWAPIPTKD